MKKYVFKVYTENKFDNVTLEELQNADLLDMDKYTIEIGGYTNLGKILADKLGIEQQNIKRIVIMNIRKETEFSITTNNKYLKNLLLDPNTQQTITKSDHYLEMKKYLFENLESKNYKDFLSNVYTYENKFKALLTNYANVYNQGTYTEEERLNALRLKQEIEKKLSEYKNYRGLCVCRQRSEEKKNYHGKEKPALTITIQPAVITQTPYRLQEQKFSTIEDKTEEYNQDNEEFLEPDEYTMMQGDSESEVKRYPRNY